jgi:hypothetical protein
MREKLAGLLAHLRLWNEAAAEAGSGDACPLASVIEDYCRLTGQAIPSATTPPAPDPPRQAAAAKAAKAAKNATPPKGYSKSPEGTEPGNGVPSGAPSAGDGDDPLLGKGPWLAAHAKIVEQEVGQVKTQAADPKQYLAAKKAFLKRNLPKLNAFLKKPGKASSPLFAYCALFLADAGEHDQAAKLLAKGIALRQKSPLKRDLHQMHADTLKVKLEALCEQVASKGQRGKDYDAARALRDELMGNAFRGNHWKANVCKTFGTLALALGDAQVAKDNFLQVKFLDPNLGVETLLAKAEAALAA